MAKFFALGGDGRWLVAPELAPKLMVAREEAVAHFCLAHPEMQSGDMIRAVARVGALAVAQATLDALWDEEWT